MLPWCWLKFEEVWLETHEYRRPHFCFFNRAEVTELSIVVYAWIVPSLPKELASVSESKSWMTRVVIAPTHPGPIWPPLIPLRQRVQVYCPKEAKEWHIKQSTFVGLGYLSCLPL